MTKSVSISNIEYKFHKTKATSVLTITPIDGVDALPNTTEVFEQKLQRLKEESEAKRKEN